MKRFEMDPSRRHGSGACVVGARTRPAPLAVSRGYRGAMRGPAFMVGEEVLYDDERYVIAGRRDGPYGYRLLASRGRVNAPAKIVWAAEADLCPLRAYTDARDDTG